VHVVDMIVVFVRHRLPTATMLDDNEDVFDSVTWETPSGAGAIHNPPSSGPGFIQSTSDSAEEPRPHDPKWEGYLITSVKDPVKELAETKDAYVSYLVSAKVRLLSCTPSALRPD
jgi:sorting nexin-4